MAIGDDFAIAADGTIDYTGTTANYTVLAFIRWIQGLADDESYTGDDRADITTATIIARSTDNIAELIAPFYITDKAAEHLYDGSIRQNGGDDLYSGLVVVGSVVSGTELQIVQNTEMLKQYWGTGINADAANNILLRMLVKTRSGGYDIDAKKIRVLARELGDEFAEFNVTMGEGNSTAAIFTNADLNNATAEATIAGWTTISNTEGWQEIDIDNNGTPEDYYSQWNIGTQTISDTYERSKWIQQRAIAEDSNADTATDYIVGNGTLTGQAQSFAMGGNAKLITKARFRLKKVGTPTGNLTYTWYTITGTHGSSAVPNVLQAQSETLDVSTLTTSYQEIELRFLGAQVVSASASTNYAVAVEYTGGDGSNYVHVEGDATGTHGGNQSDETATVWTAAAAEDLWFEVYASYAIHSMPGELFRGITHSIFYDTEVSGPFTEDAVLAWGTSFLYDNQVGTFTVGENLSFATSGSKGVLRYLDDTADRMVVTVESGTIVDNDPITGESSGATADVFGTVNDPSAVGGTGQILALDDQGAEGYVYIQLLTGSPPVDNLIMYQVGGTANARVDTNVGATPVTARTVSPEFLGQSTGANLIGAYGIGFETADVGALDKFFDLTDTQITPPNNVVFTFSGLVSGDRPLVTPRGYSFAYDNEASGPFQVGENLTLTTPTGAAVLEDLTDDGTTGWMTIRMTSGSIPTDNTAISGDTSGATANVDEGPRAVKPDIAVRQMTLNGALTGAAVTSVVVNGAIPADTPSGGTPTTIRIQRDSGVYTSHAFTSWTGSTFTIPSHDFSTDNASNGNNVYVAYIDVATAATSESYTYVYTSDRDVFLRNRDGGGTPIKDFETTSTMASSATTVSAIRTSDA